MGEFSRKKSVRISESKNGHKCTLSINSSKTPVEKNECIFHVNFLKLLMSGFLAGPGYVILMEYGQN